MISIDWNSYSINQDEDGSQVTELITCSWQEYRQGWGYYNNGNKVYLPIIGTIYNYYVDPFLAVTNISVQPESGFHEDITPYFQPNDNMMVRITVTYSSDNAVRARIRANQASCWDFKWDVELTDTNPNTVYKWIIPGEEGDSGGDPFTDDRIVGSFVDWTTEWKSANPGNDAVDDDDVPELIFKQRKAQLIFTCYSDTHLGYTFANLYLGKINRTNWSKTLVAKFQEAVIKNKQRYNTVADFNSDLNSLDVDQYMWLFSDYEITEIRPKVIKNVIYFDFNPLTWDVQQNSTIPIYETAEFNNIT